MELGVNKFYRIALATLTVQQYSKPLL